MIQDAIATMDREQLEAVIYILRTSFNHDNYKEDGLRDTLRCIMENQFSEDEDREIWERFTSDFSVVEYIEVERQINIEQMSIQPLHMALDNRFIKSTPTPLELKCICGYTISSPFAIDHGAIEEDIAFYFTIIEAKWHIYDHMNGMSMKDGLKN